MQISQDIIVWQTKFQAYLQAQHLPDSSHDLRHFEQVWKVACQIISDDNLEQEVNLLVVLTACYFHDLVSLPKNHPERSKSSLLAANKAKHILQELNFPTELIPAVMHAIEAHSFSAGVQPESLEAKVVQDADRMEALGAIGIARVFYTAGTLQQKLFDDQDPFSEDRQLDDKKYALDHFQTKLLSLHTTMQTAAGRKLAEDNTEYLASFLNKIRNELVGNYTSSQQPLSELT